MKLLNTILLFIEGDINLQKFSDNTITIEQLRYNLKN